MTPTFSNTARAVLIIAAFALAGITAQAVPAGISFSRITPIDNGNLLVARTAANNPLGPPTFQLKADVFFNNNGTMDRSVTSVRISYPGSSIGSFT